MKAIANSTLHPHVLLPGYNRRALKIRMVHLGFSAVHHVRQARFTDAILSKTGLDHGARTTVAAL